MTEKHYGGDSGLGKRGNLNASAAKKPIDLIANQAKKDSITSSSVTMLKQPEIQKLIKAGEIAREVKAYARTIIRRGTPLSEAAEKIEEKIIELGGKPAFPTNLSINAIAAHSTPLLDDKEIAAGLLKIDLGVHIDGYVADTAFSMDIEVSKENKLLIEAAENALKKATETIGVGVPLTKVGEAIETEVKRYGFLPIQNLSGHSIEQYNLHAGVNIPNYNNLNLKPITEGIYALEPFTTNGVGSIRDGKPSSIYHFIKDGTVRDPTAREVLQHIKEEYQTLPFCARWLQKKFGARTLLALKRIEEAGLIQQYSQLVEKGGGKVAQAEHTIIITEKEKIITT